MKTADSFRRGYHDLPRPEILARVPTTARRILDLGCGTGALGKALKERQPCHVTGIELNKAAYEVAVKNLDVALCDNLNRFDPKIAGEKYDCIILADILEHLINPWSVLSKFSKALSDAGTIVASIPNVAHPWIIKNLEKGLFRYENAGILDITHLRFMTKTSIFQMFCKAGLKITACEESPNKDNPIQFLITAVKPVIPFSNPSTTILILTWNGWQYTKQCIDSIKQKTNVPFQILVIDNGSTDETIKELRADTTLLHIENSCNLGFAAGFNVGLMLVRTPYFVLCNSDVVVTPNWLLNMTGHIETDPKLMLLGAVSNHVSGPQKIKDVPYRNAIELDRFASVQNCDCAPAITYCPRIVFFFTLFKSEVLQKIGYLDEIFGLGNFEDDDYCMRIWKKGLKTAYTNRVFIHHYGSRGFGKDIDAFKKLLEKNGQLFMKKWKLKTYGGLNARIDL